VGAGEAAEGGVGFAHGGIIMFLGGLVTFPSLGSGSSLDDGEVGFFHPVIFECAVEAPGGISADAKE